MIFNKSSLDRRIHKRTVEIRGQEMLPLYQDGLQFVPLPETADFMKGLLTQ